MNSVWIVVCWIHTVICVSVVILGVVGNTLALIVLSPQRRSSANFLLMALAVADNLYLMAHIPRIVYFIVVPLGHHVVSSRIMLYVPFHTSHTTRRRDKSNVIVVYSTHWHHALHCCCFSISCQALYNDYQNNYNARDFTNSIHRITHASNGLCLFRVVWDATNMQL